MATTDFIAAIELGSSKITGMAGTKKSDGSIHILACAHEDSSSFMRKGTIYNIGKAAQSLTNIVNKLEDDLKCDIAKVYVGISGQSLRSIRNVVHRDVDPETGEVSQGLVDMLSDINRDTPLVDNTLAPMTILDVVHQEYKVDKNSQLNPVGALGRHIEGHFLNIVARTALLANLAQCFKRADLEMAEYFISPMALADAVLSENERRSGCALIDFGAETTTISVYKNNLLRYLTVLPLGGNSITRDLTTLQIEEPEAEQLKIEYGDAAVENDYIAKDADKPTCTLSDGRTVELEKVNDIVEARTREIVANVWNLLQDSGYEDKLLSGLVLTGGAANLRGLTTALQKTTGISKIRVARFVHHTVYAYDESLLRRDGTQNTILALLFAGKENCCLQAEPKPAEPAPEPGEDTAKETQQPENGHTQREEPKVKKRGLFDRLQKTLFDDGSEF